MANVPRKTKNLVREVHMADREWLAHEEEPRGVVAVGAKVAIESLFAEDEDRGKVVAIEGGKAVVLWERGGRRRHEAESLREMVVGDRRDEPGAA